jgi:hypothetical protein
VLVDLGLEHIVAVDGDLQWSSQCRSTGFEERLNAEAKIAELYVAKGAPPVELAERTPELH